MTSLFGAPVITVLPPVLLGGDNGPVFAQLAARVATARVALFPDIGIDRLDDFFHLRLAQILSQRTPSSALSVVVLTDEFGVSPLAGGFADRFRSSWPFMQCVFVTEHGDPDHLSTLLGLPVSRLDGAPRVVRPDTIAGQKIALQIQIIWPRCGSTTAFENQIEGLVQAGSLTIRVFADQRRRRGASLDAWIAKVIPENSFHAGAHINVLAVPAGPHIRWPDMPPDVDWATWLQAAAACEISDTAVLQAGQRAHAIIANHIDTVGLALIIAPYARLLLDVHDDLAVATRAGLLRQGASEAEADAQAAAAARAQADILAIPAICTHVSVTELERLAPHCRRSAIVLPRIYTSPPLPATPPRFDLLLVGDEHIFNIEALRWFLDAVWLPHLQPHGITAAIVGRAGPRVYDDSYETPLLTFMGFVEDLEIVRAWCRLSVVPDQGGTGVAVKTLTTMAMGHPVAITSAGLRGLDRTIAAMLPAFDDPGALAADILGLLRNPDRLTARRDLVRKVQAAIRGGPGYADLLQAQPRPTARMRREREARWAQATAAAIRPDKRPHRFALDAPFPMSGDPSDQHVLLDGWHEAEPWGRWMDGAEAGLRLDLAEPTDEPLKLELDIIPSAANASLTLLCDGTDLGAIEPTRGPNAWRIPKDLSRGKTGFILTLRVDETHCPSATGDSDDQRVLGIGVSAIRLRSRQPTLCEPGQRLPIQSATAPREVLLTGWHPIEDWGCWSNGPAATLQINFAAPLQGPVRLDLELVTTQAAPKLTLTVNDTALQPVQPVDGSNKWDLPPAVTDGQTRLLVTVAVSETFCPAIASDSADDRILGIGLRGLRVQPFVPAQCVPGVPLRLSPPVALDDILLAGWHKPESWGCWTSGPDATMRLRFETPLSGAFRLELNLANMPVETLLTVTVNSFILPAVKPLTDGNVWMLEPEMTEGQRDLTIDLQTSQPFRPSDLGHPGDDRLLGVGVRTITLHRESAEQCPIGQRVRFSRTLGDNGMLLTGWHKLEDWGCWSAGRDATLRLRFAEPLDGEYRLELDMVPPLLDMNVTLVVNETELEPMYVMEGPNEWILPRDHTDGHTELLLRLRVAQPVRPIDVIESTDDRVLGVGLRAAMIRPF